MEILELKNQITNPVNEDQFEDLQSEAEDRIRFGSISDRLEMADLISEILLAQGPALQRSAPDQYEYLQKFWSKLTFKSLPGLKSYDQDALLQKRLFAAVQNGVDVSELADEFYEVYDEDQTVDEIFSGFVQDLEQNSETLGNIPIEVEGKKYIPQIKYWLLDYSKFPSRLAKRGVVERLNYVNQSPNTRQLTQGQRQNLLTLLKFYDEILNPERPLKFVRRTQEVEDQDLDEIKENQIPVAPEFPQVPRPPIPVNLRPKFIPELIVPVKPITPSSAYKNMPVMPVAKFPSSPPAIFAAPHEAPQSSNYRPAGVESEPSHPLAEPETPVFNNYGNVRFARIPEDPQTNPSASTNIEEKLKQLKDRLER